MNFASGNTTISKFRHQFSSKLQALAANGDDTNPSTQIDSPFDSLDGFTLSSIMDHLNLIDSINMAVVAPQHRNTIARYIIMDKFKLHEQEISIIFNKDPHIAVTNHGRIANGLDEVLSILNSFGYIFKRIKVHIYPNGPLSTATIAQYLTKYCPEAEQNLVFYSTILKEWDFSFVNATKIIFYRSILHKNDVPLNRWFPRMKQLELNEPFSLGMLNQHFPQLTTFILRVNYETDTIVDFREFIRLNPQIRSFEMPLTRDNSILCHLNEMMPNLETLIIGKAKGVFPYLDADRPTHFKNVKHFSWGITKANSGVWDTKILDRFRTMTFDHLEAIVIDSDESRACEIHIGAIVKNTELKKVEIPTCEMRLEYLTRLVQGLPDLKVLTIGWERIYTLSALERFLAIDMEVEQINIRIVDENKELSKDRILKVIPSKWKFSSMEIDGGVEVLTLLQSLEQ